MQANDLVVSFQKDAHVEVVQLDLQLPACRPCEAAAGWNQQARARTPHQV